MNDKPTLSICIPTYNRGNYLKELLLSIINNNIRENIKGKIEICVSDNNSTDNTEVVMAEIQKLSDIKIKFHKNHQNMGADFNYLKSVEISNGTYCWLIGSDDAITTNSINEIIDLIEYNDDVGIFLFDRIETDINMKPYRYRKWLREDIKTLKIDTHNHSELSNYFLHVRSLGGIFSYLSSIIVKKSLWDSVKFDDIFIGTAYAHVYILLSILVSGTKFMYINKAYVLCRTGNDSFFQNLVQRFLLDIDGYLKLREKVIKTESLGIDFIEIIKYEHPFYNIIRIYSFSNKEMWNSNIKPKLLKIGYSEVELRNIERYGFIYKKTLFLRKLLSKIKKILKSR
ncbi:MAG: glycosyltransferase family 2 protein [Athalassotoga sp.]